MNINIDIKIVDFEEKLPRDYFFCVRKKLHLIIKADFFSSI